MFSRRLKAGYFALEGLNSFATVYYFYYFYFFMQTEFGFGNKANLALAALNGAIYAVMAWQGGKFAQRFGYFTALKIGFGVMAGALVVGGWLHTAGGHIVIMSVAVVGMCFTWPTLEALVSEGEPPEGVQRMVGIYNLVWSGTGALAYFTGGAMFEKLGARSLFYVPAGIVFGQIILALWLEKQARRQTTAPGFHPAAAPPVPEPESPPHSAARTRMFLRLAWLANPFAYIAINTLIAVIPGVAQRLELSPMIAGYCCSLWCFSRLGAFLLLWRWSGWHYRFRWLLAAYVALIGTFAAIVMAPNLAMLILAQLAFGVAAGLIYYSSLFYSMDLGDTKGEHGGIHEAVIGLGNFAGPAVGAASLHFLPQHANSGALAVSGLLLLGLGGLLAIWRKKA
ncbi:MAG TPA: MFS transporter [Verrucomicrobiota bacterium]|jgi:predicted MFS family arabinose efflux permease|nr:MFS transporter [Verrucomicrobiota bacterium]HQL77740.1 MFS transporter [Verrucomicrobiota bacterium]